MDCDVHGNVVAGIIADSQANSINIIDSNFDENGIAVLVNFGAQVRIEGNCMESNTAPAIVASNIAALTIRDNYCETFRLTHFAAIH